MRNQSTSFDRAFEEGWITEGITEDAVDFAEKLGEHLTDSSRGFSGRDAMTTSQIRNFFGEVKRIQQKDIANEKSAFILLRPKLAYAVARATQRNSRNRITVFKEIIDKAHKAVNIEGTEADKRFQSFVDFLEAILAYHKAYGGRD
ncbi:MAG: type III-A CRISPR-associated protein Csm2 [Chitinophagales bacterium]